MNAAIGFIAAVVLGVVLALFLKRSSARWIFVASASVAVLGIVGLTSTEIGEITGPIAMFALPIAGVVSGPAVFVRESRGGVLAAIALSSAASAACVVATAYIYLLYACAFGGGCV